MRRILTALAVAALGAACSSGGGSPSAPASAGGGGGNAVAIVDFEFQPRSITISAGQSVTWTNNGGTDHSVEWPSDNPIAWPEGKESDSITPGSSTRPLAFMEAGTFDYVCGIHSNMTGTVVVQ